MVDLSNAAVWVKGMSRLSSANSFWLRLADDLGAELIEPENEPAHISTRIEEWPLIVSPQPCIDGELEEIAFAVRFKDRHAYTMRIGKNHWRSSAIQRGRVSTGYSDIDTQCIIASNDQQKTRAIFTNNTVRTWINQQSTAFISVEPYDAMRKLTRMTLYVALTRNIDIRSQFNFVTTLMTQLGLVGVASREKFE